MKTGLFLKVTRINFLPASMIPFITGAVLAYREGISLSIMKVVLGSVGVASAHLAGNLFNDLFDHRSGADIKKKKESPFFGGSGVIQKGLVSEEKIFYLALIFASVALACGTSVFIMTKDPVFIVMMIIAGVFTAGYTMPPLKLAYRRLGEIDIFFLFGVFLVTASYYLFTGRFTIAPFILSLPVSFLIMSVILCNEVPDIENDISSGKKNLISLSGKSKGYIFYSAAVVLSYMTLLLNIAMGELSVYAAGLIIFYFLGFKAAVILKRKNESFPDLVKASAMTVALHALVGTGMIIGILIKGRLLGL